MFRVVAKRSGLLKNNSKNAECCKNCRFFATPDKTESIPVGCGFCKRYPPTLVHCNGSERFDTSFPCVADIQWCGEWISSAAHVAKVGGLYQERHMAIKVKTRRREFILGVMNVPGRKRRCLYIQEGAVIKPIAYFVNDEYANEFDNAIDDIVEAVESSLGGGLRKSHS